MLLSKCHQLVEQWLEECIVRKDLSRFHNRKVEVLPDASWSALRTESPLQRWQLIKISDGIAPALCSLQIDKSILCYLLGEPSLPEKLQGLFKSTTIDAAITKLQPSHQQIASQLAAIWFDTTESLTPVVQLCGLESITNINIAATACDFAGINLHIIKAHLFATKADELKQLMVLWSRQALLSNSALLLDCQEVSTILIPVLVIAHIEHRSYQGTKTNVFLRFQFAVKISDCTHSKTLKSQSRPQYILPMDRLEDHSTAQKLVLPI